MIHELDEIWFLLTAIHPVLANEFYLYANRDFDEFQSIQYTSQHQDLNLPIRDLKLRKNYWWLHFYFISNLENFKNKNDFIYTNFDNQFLFTID
jgi:hypothetical protein